MEENIELNNYKKQIKSWEAEFLRTNSKKPSKDDIQNAPVDIQDAYRSYWKLRNKFDNRESEIETEKDAVWNSSLNKSSQACYKKKYVSETDRFYEKLKQRLEQHINDSTTIESPAPRNKLETPKSGRCLAESLLNVTMKPEIANGRIATRELDWDIKFEAARATKFITSHDVVNKVSSVNMLSPAIKTLNPFKTLRFKQDVDEDWLKRCDDNILKDQKEIDVENSLRTFTLSDACKAQVKEMLIYTSAYLENNMMKPLECCAPLKRNNMCINLNSEEKDSQSQHDVKKKSCNFNNVAIKSRPNCTYEDNNSFDKIDTCNDDASVFSQSISSELKNDSSLDLDKSPLKVNQLEDNVEDTRITKKRKLSCMSQVSDSVSSKKANHLKRKIAAGTLNENFVSLNIKKKKFSRGHRQVNVRKLKWQKWKQMKNGGGSTSTNTGCFKCGQIGHWARQCNVSASIKESNAQLEEDDFEETPLPTLEEAAKLAQDAKYTNLKDKRLLKSEIASKSLPTDSTNAEVCETTADNANVDENKRVVNNLPHFETDLPKEAMTPLYETSEDGKPIDTPKAVFDALNEMGYSDFRNGQEAAIMRVLCGLSTLVVLPTGSGKSLCYQLPAYMYAKHSKSLAIVVSPLVSLMEDQVTGLPPCLHAVCLHSGMTEVQKSNAVKDISDGVAQILLVSPEAIIGGYRFSDTILNSSMPPISFVCIDEVHCISQWSHNFRPSYLQLYKVLTQKMGVKCILGLTATATQFTIEDIISHLDLKCIEDSVVGRTNVPRNLLLSVSRDKDKDRALIQLLNGDRFRNCSSIIIYCIRRVETERLAALIRTCMQDELEPEAESMTKKKKSKSKKRNFAWTAEAYHAGLQPSRRRSIQKQFMTGKLRIVIATVAFGMGLDKPDVRAIIHFNMPKNFESYVQEIGRAGRDGLDSHCHVFLDSEGHDLWEQQRHIFSNSIDRHTLRKLLRRVFVPCKCAGIKDSKEGSQNLEVVEIPEQKIVCPRHEIAFPINETVQELDVKEENISTLLCYLELHSMKWIEILPPTYATCTIRCYGGPKQMHTIALENPAISMAIALAAENGKKWEKGSHFTFPIVEVASALEWKTATLKRDLKRLEWNNMSRKTGVMVEFADLAFHLNGPGNLSGEELDAVLDFLHNKVVSAEESELKNLNLLFSVFQRYSSSRYWECCDEVNIEHSDGIKSAINKYFERADLLCNEIKETIQPSGNESHNEVDVSFVKSLIKDIICTHHDHTFTGRAIARIFHGISSPCFPSEVWGRVRKFWRCLLPVNFNVILKMANEELRHFR